jgi:D-galactarolactone cycloisomerase
MKITQAEVIHVYDPISPPTGPAGVFSQSRETLLLKLTCEDATVGWGETYALPGNKEVLRGLAEALVGADPMTAAPPRGVPVVDEVGVAGAAGAVDMALFDLRGKLLDIPAYVLLGGAVRSWIPVYASGFMYEPGVHPRDAWPREAAAHVEAGFKAMKVRMGLFPVKEELRAFAELRAFLPDDVRLMVDAWGSYSIHEALVVGRALQDLDVVWFEEPASPYADYAGYEVLTAALDLPIAGGEMGRTVGEFKRLFDRRALDIAQPDIAICGGLGNAAAVATVARLYGIPCVPHSWNGAVMAAATLQLIATLPAASQVDRLSALTMEYDTTENRFIRDIVIDPLELVDGGFSIPTRPGLGIELDEDVVRRYAVA